MTSTLEIIREITRDWGDINKVENKLKESRDRLRKLDMNIDMWELYDMITIQLDMLDSPDYGDFDGRVFISILNKLDNI